MEQIKNIIQASIDVKQSVLQSDELLQTVSAIVDVVVTAFKKATGFISAATAAVRLMRNT